VMRLLTDLRPIYRHLGSFAIVALGKNRRHSFLSPDFVARSFRARSKVTVPLFKIPVNCPHRFFCRLIIAVMNDSPRHPAKYRLDHIQELSAGGKRDEFQSWHTRRTLSLSVKPCHRLLEPFRQMPRCRVPREVERFHPSVLFQKNSQQADHLLRVLVHRIKMSNLISAKFQCGGDNQTPFRFLSLGNGVVFFWPYQFAAGFFVIWKGPNSSIEKNLWLGPMF